jgi:hypothetical protein
MKQRTPAGTASLLPQPEGNTVSGPGAGNGFPPETAEHYKFVIVAWAKDALLLWKRPGNGSLPSVTLLGCICPGGKNKGALSKNTRIAAGRYASSAISQMEMLRPYVTSTSGKVTAMCLLVSLQSWFIS